MRLACASPLIAACLAASLAAPRASAQGAPEDPREVEGRSLRAQGRDAEALALFRDAYGRTRSMRTLARLALAEAALGRWSDAEAHLVEALASSDPWVTANRREPAGGLEGSLAQVRAHLGSLDVRCRTPGAELWIAGERRGALPLAHPARVVEGALSVEVRAEGYLTAVQSVAIRGGAAEATVVEFDLARVPTSNAPRGPAAVVSPAAPRVIVEAPRAPRLRPYGLAGLAVGVGGLALGVGAYLAGAAAVDEFTDANCYAADDGGYRWEPTRGVATPPACDALGDRATTWRAVELTGFIAGGLFAAAGVALTLWPDGRERPARAALSCAPFARGVGLTCGGTF